MVLGKARSARWPPHEHPRLLPRQVRQRPASWNCSPTASSWSISAARTRKTSWASCNWYSIPSFSKRATRPASGCLRALRPSCAPGPRRYRLESADLRRFPPETALSRLQQGPAEPPHQGIGSDARKTCRRCLTFAAILPMINSKITLARQFRPSARLGIPIISFIHSLTLRPLAGCLCLGQCQHPQCPSHVRPVYCLWPWARWPWSAAVAQGVNEKGISVCNRCCRSVDNYLRMVLRPVIACSIRFYNKGGHVRQSLHSTSSFHEDATCTVQWIIISEWFWEPCMVA